MEQETKQDLTVKKEPKKEKLKWDDTIVQIFKQILQFNYHEYGTRKEILK